MGDGRYAGPQGRNKRKERKKKRRRKVIRNSRRGETRMGKGSARVIGLGIEPLARSLPPSPTVGEGCEGGIFLIRSIFGPFVQVFIGAP